MYRELETQIYGNSSKAIIKQVINLMTDSVYLKGLDGRYLGCNLEFEQIIGLKEADLVERTVFDFNDFDIANALLDSDQEVINTGRPAQQEIWISKADGTKALVKSKKKPLYDHNGNVVAILGVIQDITKQKETEIALNQCQEKYELFAEHALDVVWVLNLNTNQFKYLSPSVQQLWGYTVEEALLLKLEDLMTPESLVRVYDQITLALSEFNENANAKQSYYNQVLQVCKNGELIWVEYLARLKQDQSGDIIAIGASRNIDQRKKAEQALIESEEKYRMIAENTSDTIWVYNLDQDRFTYYSPSVSQLRGLTVEAALSEKILESVMPEFRAMISERINDAKIQLLKHPEMPNTHTLEIKQPTQDGKAIWVEVSARMRYNDNKEIEILGVNRNIEDRKKIEQEMLYLGYYDQLTGVYNRHYFEMVINEAIEKSDRYDEPFSMLLLDLDRFKSVNDTWGHQVGDELLKLTAKVIKNCIRSSDELFRFGGEEFLILMPQTTLDGAAEASEKIRVAIEKVNHPIVGIQTVSIGVGQRSKNESFEPWYRRVDDALYRAKTTGRNRIVACEVTSAYSVDPLRIRWRSDWDSGHDEIDQQHQELIRIASTLMNMSLAGVEHQETDELIELLLNKIVDHFEFEEMILSNIAYPEYDSHQKIHKDLIAKALRIKDAYKNGSIMLSAIFTFVVEDLILVHLIEDDMKFFPYTRRNS